MKHTSALIILCLCLNWGWAQNVEVWPGDANNDGKVSSLDLLYLGLSFNQQVQSRNDTTLQWQAYLANNFIALQPTGLSIVYADCNGDGFINANDIEVIEDNYKETRAGFTPDVFYRGNPNDPQIYFDGLPSLVNEGETVTLALHLGTTANPVDNFFGGVFSIYYDTTIVKAGSISVQYDQSSVLSNNFNAPLLFSKEDSVAGKVDVAISLKANTGGAQAQNISVAGPVLFFTFIIEDNLMGVAWNDWDLDLRIDEIKVLDKDLQETLIYNEPANVAVKNTVSIGPSTNLNFNLSIYPNPTNNKLTIETEGTNYIESVSLINISGQQVHAANLQKPENNLSLSLAELPAGMYILQVVSTEGITHKRLVVQH